MCSESDVKSMVNSKAALRLLASCLLEYLLSQ